MIQLTGGQWNGRKIKTLPGNSTRPTNSLLRQALFNSLQGVVEGANVLDLFAGNGTLGFEALSRGATRVTFIESHPRAASIIRSNAHLLEIENYDSLLGRFPGVLNDSLSAPYDIVFADPPYSGGFELPILQNLRLASLCAPEGFLCLEWSPLKSGIPGLPEEVNGWKKVREKKYGDSILTNYRRMAK